MLLFAIFPFDLRGPEFLVFYPVFCVIIFSVAGYLRWKLREPSECVSELPEDPYEIAWLAGRGRSVAIGAIANLLSAESIGVLPGERRLHAITPPAPGTHPIDRFVYGKIDDEGHLRVHSIVSAISEVAEPLEHSLRERGLVLDRLTRSQAFFYPATLALLPLLVGVIKIFVGISRDRPVGILIVLCLVTAAVYSMLFVPTPIRSRNGDAALQALREQHAERKAKLLAAKDQWPLLVALYGVESFASTPLAPLIPLFSAAGTSSGGDGGSCSGSGCGGGGSSGCGGCGGGH